VRLLTHEIGAGNDELTAQSRVSNFAIKSPAREGVRRAHLLESLPGGSGLELISFDAHINEIGI